MLLALSAAAGDGGCAAWDAGCITSSAATGVITNVMVSVVQQMANFLADTLYNSFKFTSGVGGTHVVNDIGGSLIVIAVFVLVLTLAIQVVKAGLTFSTAAIGKAVLMAAIAVALMRITFWLFPQVQTLFDDMTLQLLQGWGFSAGGVVDHFMLLFGYVQNGTAADGTPTYGFPDDGTLPDWLADPSVEAGASIGSVVVTALTLVFLLVCSGLLMLALAFRDYALVVMVALAPVAFMLLPLDRGRAVARNWASIVLALLIAKPLAAVILMIGVKMIGDTANLTGYFVSVIAILFASASPIAAFGFFRWLGVEAGHAVAGSAGESVVGRFGGVSGAQSMVRGGASVARSLRSSGGSAGGGGAAQTIGAPMSSGATASAGGAAGGTAAAGGAAAAGGGAAAGGAAAGAAGGPVGIAAGAAVGTAASGGKKVASAAGNAISGAAEAGAAAVQAPPAEPSRKPISTSASPWDRRGGLS